MCATCVAQGIAYIGGALGTLRLMAARAEARRNVPMPPTPDVDAQANESLDETPASAPVS
jgi:hypothetical protein